MLLFLKCMQAAEYCTFCHSHLTRLCIESSATGLTGTLELLSSVDGDGAVIGGQHVVHQLNDADLNILDQVGVQLDLRTMCAIPINLCPTPSCAFFEYVTADPGWLSDSRQT